MPDNNCPIIYEKRTIFTCHLARSGLFCCLGRQKYEAQNREGVSLRQGAGDVLGLWVNIMVPLDPSVLFPPDMCEILAPMFW